MSAVEPQNRVVPLHKTGTVLPFHNAAQHQAHTNPVVIVGNGPVGMRMVQELLSRSPKTPIVVYGEETHLPYDRVRLSSWLCGELPLEQFVKPYRRPFGARVEERLGFRVTDIDIEKSTISDSSGLETRYSKLVLATGSSAFVPDIKGKNTEGVYTFRDLDDAIGLMARRIRSRHTVVIGGGLLGLETARGMLNRGTQVTVVEHADRLMANQLDLEASERLKQHVESLGIQVILQNGIQSIEGRPRVQSVRLQSGWQLDCDTVIMAAGIRPRIDLAKKIGLAFGRGIRVDDHMCTSAEHIYAIGECAEHRGEVYGLVAPGFEHAGVAANHIAGKPGDYQGSIAAARLKVIDTQVFSVGPMGHTAHPLNGHAVTYKNPKTGAYRKLLFNRNRLIGAIGIGEWPQTVRLQSAVAEADVVYPWQRLRFKFTGNLWSEGSANAVSAWPESTTVCQCMGVSRGRISEAIVQGAQSVNSIGQACGAGTVCGSCKPLVNSLLGKQTITEKIRAIKPLIVFSALALIAVLAFLLSPVVAYSQSVQPFELAGQTLHLHWDRLWREGLYKQWTGYTVLAAATLASLLSFRKRFRFFDRTGQFDYWRVAHIGLSVFALAGLMLHTGFRFGYGLNFMLMSVFMAMIVLGTVAAFVISARSLIPSGVQTLVQRYAVRLHIYLFWPVPVLLGWHILKGYWY